MLTEKPHSEYEKNCTIYISSDKSFLMTSAQIQKSLESNSDKQKAEALENLILLMMTGELLPKMLMTVIRYVVTNNDHRIKKLLQIYWEVVEKVQANGELKEEIILVCNALRNDLMHPNEYIRGSTLRCLCKIRHLKIIEPLTEAILKNLSDRHAYVRRLALICVYSIYKNFGSDVCGSCEEVESILLTEGDVSTKRNAFLMLAACEPAKAVSYILGIKESISSSGDALQHAVVEFIVNVGYTYQPHQKELLEILMILLKKSCLSVKYSAALALASLSPTNTVLKDVCETLLHIVSCHSDTSCRVIGVSTIQKLLKDNHKEILEDSISELLRPLSNNIMGVRIKIIDICLQSLTSKNVNLFLTVLKQELQKVTAQLKTTNDSNDVFYKQLLLRSIHIACSLFPAALENSIQLLLDFMLDSDVVCANEASSLMREVIVKQPKMRSIVLKKICQILPEITHSKVIRSCLWILGEYADELNSSDKEVDGYVSILETIVSVVGLAPFCGNKSETSSVVNVAGGDETGKDINAAMSRMCVNDISTQPALQNNDAVHLGERKPHVIGSEEKPSVTRNLIQQKDYLLATVVCSCISTLLIRANVSDDSTLSVDLKTRCLLVITSILRFVRSDAYNGISTDTDVHITKCLHDVIDELNGKVSLKESTEKKVLYFKNQLVELMEDQGDSFDEFYKDHGKSSNYTNYGNHIPLVFSPNPLFSTKQAQVNVTSASSILQIRQLQKKAGGESEKDRSIIPIDNLFCADVEKKTHTDTFERRLSRLQQVTGYADPIYIESSFEIDEFSITIHFLLINKSNATLQNVLLELYTHGDVKLMLRPHSVTLPVNGKASVSANVRVSSCETGVIFGYATYTQRENDIVTQHALLLNEHHIDLAHFIKLSFTPLSHFRNIWVEFEWENKINLTCNTRSPLLFLCRIILNTNMTLVETNAEPLEYKKLSIDEAINILNGYRGNSNVSIQSDQELDCQLCGNKYTNSVLNVCSMCKLGISKSDYNDDTIKYIAYILMKPELIELQKHTQFFSANLYVLSVFGECALANFSVEKETPSRLVGSVRIRARTQGIALALGDKISNLQRSLL